MWPLSFPEPKSRANTLDRPQYHPPGGHWSRRSFVQAGGSTLLGLGMGSLLKAAPSVLDQGFGRAKSVILINLTGGLSHIDSLDPKPSAPEEIRGEFKTISTKHPGIAICEHLPKLAASLDRWALVRSFSHGENGHLPGTHRLLTGVPMPNQRQTDLDNVLSRRDWPCYGAAVSQIRPRKDGIPGGVTLPHALIEGPLTWPGQHAGILGPHYDPLLVSQDPNNPTFQMESLSMGPGFDISRMENRKSLLDLMDKNPDLKAHQGVAFDMLLSGKVTQAFRLEMEPDRNRERYGRNMFGQSMLLARRLAQAGVPVIQANMGIVQSWDTHTDNWGSLKNRLLPWTEQGLTALEEDLASSGLLDSTLIVVMGEFGRTPKISTLPGQTIAGRDHWASCYSGMLAGAGIKTGQVIGKSDSKGAYPASQSYSPMDLGTTIYHALGIPMDATIADPLGRNLNLMQGQIIEALYRG